MKKTPKQYIEDYYESYASGEVDEETKIVGMFLVENATGRVLDCGCGPVSQLWAIFMPKMEELHAIDLPLKSISFVKDKIANIREWYQKFNLYQKVVEDKFGPLSEKYIISQVANIKSVQQADMTKKLPFQPNYFDTVISLYSLGCLKNEKDLKKAILNIKKILKPGGKLLHINTNGENKNNVLPAYTWNGLSQASVLIENTLKSEGFKNIQCEEIDLNSNPKGMYKYSAISLLSATK